MWKFQAGNALALTIWDFSVPVHIIGGLWLVSLFLDILLETMRVDHLQDALNLHCCNFDGCLQNLFWIDVHLGVHIDNIYENIMIHTRTYIYIYIHTRTLGVPPRGLLCHQLFRVCLGVVCGLFIYVGFIWRSFRVFRVYHGFNDILLSRLTWGFMSDLGFWGLGFRDWGFVFWQQISSAIRPFRRHPKMHKTLVLRSQSALLWAAPLSWPMCD